MSTLSEASFSMHHHDESRFVMRIGFSEGRRRYIIRNRQKETGDETASVVQERAERSPFR